jgi:predicted Zn-dependent protease
MKTNLPKFPVELWTGFCRLLSMSSEPGLNQEALAVLRLMRYVQPKADALVVSEAWNLISSRNLLDARTLLEDAERQFPESASVKAILAFCLEKQDDPLWHAYANEARQMANNEDALDILAMFDPEAVAA